MPEVTLTLQNETPDSLTYGETSPRDPQSWTVAGNDQKTVSITDNDPGTMHIIVCSGLLGSILWECEPGQDNRLEISVLGPGKYCVEASSNPADAFTVKATNSTVADIYCLVIGPGSLYLWGHVGGENAEKSFNVDTTGFIKVLFFASFFGQASFPLPGQAQDITVTAEVSNGMPTVSGPTPNYNWSALGTGLNNTGDAMTAFDDGDGAALYAGGPFTTAGGATANYVAKWYGSQWSALGSGLGAGSEMSVQALTVFETGTKAALYAGGRFGTAGGVTVNNIAKWNGTSWSALGSGLQGGVPSSGVYALTVFNDGIGAALYAGGQFTTAGGVTVNNIAKWNGTSWSALGTGLQGNVSASLVTALTVFNDGNGAALYVGGVFSTAGGVAANHVAKWDGSNWSALGAGLNAQVDALTVFDDGTGAALYAGGQFTTAGGMTMSYIARWDGTSWSALGTGVDGAISALQVFDDGSGPALYAGGFLTTAGGVTVNYIAKWDGTSWSALGSGMDSEVLGLAVFDDGTGAALFAGGTFNQAGGVPARGIAKCAVSWW